MPDPLMLTPDPEVERLLPCPFCGGQAETREERDDEGCPTFYIYCTTPGCGGNAEGVEPEYARETWQMRAALPRATPSRELEEWLAELLYKHDPMCGQSDCEYTARKILPEILSLLPASRAGWREALEYYADEARWRMNSAGVAPAMDDRGHRAREALAAPSLAAAPEKG